MQQQMGISVSYTIKFIVEIKDRKKEKKKLTHTSLKITVNIFFKVNSVTATPVLVIVMLWDKPQLGYWG